MFRRHVAEWADIRDDACRAHLGATTSPGTSPVDGIAGHCLDVPFVFDVLDDPAVGRVAGPNPPQDLADRVHQAYVRFVTEGDPGWLVLRTSAGEVRDPRPAVAARDRRLSGRRRALLA